MRRRNPHHIFGPPATPHHKYIEIIEEYWYKYAWLIVGACQGIIWSSGTMKIKPSSGGSAGTFHDSLFTYHDLLGLWGKSWSWKTI